MISLFGKTVEKQNCPENMQDRMLAKKYIIIYEEPVHCRKQMENMYSEKLQDHKSGGAKTDYNSENKESSFKIFVFHIKSSNI